ncbi:hypothetical protein ACYOEI_03395 [Singulisphaera rosea]
MFGAALGDLIEGSTTGQDEASDREANIRRASTGEPVSKPEPNLLFAFDASTSDNVSGWLREIEREPDELLEAPGRWS